MAYVEILKKHVQNNFDYFILMVAIGGFTRGIRGTVLVEIAKHMIGNSIDKKKKSADLKMFKQKNK